MTDSNRSVSERLKEFSQYAEMKQLAFRIKSLQAQKQFQSLAVLSYFPGEGKTFLCTALALAYADVSRSRVSIIDTSTRQNEGALTLQECLSPAERRVAVLSMEEIRNGTRNFTDAASPTAGNQVVHSPEIVSDAAGPHARTSRTADTPLFRAMTEEGKTHGLVIIDTVSLNSKNRSNVDPLMTARQSDASILVVGRKLLNSPEVEECMKIVQDPTLHLIGVVSNDEYSA